MSNIYNSTLVIDIETTNLDKDKGRIKRIGYYSYKYGRYVNTSDFELVAKIVKEHNTIVGYNCIDFDIPYMQKYGITVSRTQTVLDLMVILKKRQPIMKTKFKSFSLKNVCKQLKLSEEKGDIDLDILCAETNTDEEKVLIDKYLKQDVVTTRNLYEWLENEFEPLKEFLPMMSRANYGHLLLSTGSYAYKVVCNMAGIEEIYNHAGIDEEYEGGFVAKPSCKEARGKIYCLDFKSAYPHAFMMQNLFSLANEGYSGNDLWKLNGIYNTEQLGVIEKVIQKLFALRTVYKRNKDPREYAVKIIINCFYGLTGNPKFAQVYNITTASDCTHTVQEWIKFARKTYKDEGYEVLYSDTDSVFLQDVYEDEPRLLVCKDYIINEIKKRVPFPLDTFDMGIDARIKSIFFFDGADGKEKKKNYIYITEENKVVIKGLPIIKSNASLLSQLILKKLKPQMAMSGEIKFLETKIKDMVYNRIREDISNAQTEYKVFDRAMYKSDTCIQVAILEMYGKGRHQLIKNNKIGAGKGVKYCTIKEAKEKLTIDDLDLSRVWVELKPFMKSTQKTLW